MTKILFKTRYYLEYKIELQNPTSGDVTSTNLPSNLQSFKQKLLTRNGFVEYK